MSCIVGIRSRPDIKLTLAVFLSCHSSRVSDTLNPATIRPFVLHAVLVEVDARVDDLRLSAPPSPTCGRTSSEVLRRERAGDDLRLSAPPSPACVRTGSEVLRRERELGALRSRLQ